MASGLKDDIDAPASKMNHGFRGLVVDDDDFSRATAVRILKRLGATNVLEAATGDVALTLAAQASEPIDLILCDLCMPKVDGIETLAGLAIRSPSAMFVLASGAELRLLRAAAASAQRAGINALHVMAKPITLAKTQEAIATMVASRHPEPSVAHRQTIDYGFTAADLQRGLAAGEFTVAYQPKIAVTDRHICGSEALVRWQHPHYGLLPAAAFIQIVQTNEMFEEIFRFVLSAAVAQCARWRDCGFDGGVSVNLPVAVLASRDLPNLLDDLVASHGLPLNQITFEVTEDGWLQGKDQAREVLTRLRVRGFGLSIDDFGTGYSSMQQLLNAPFNELKIDRSFVRAAPTDVEARIAVGSMVTLGRQLGMRVVAEGVETQAEWDLVADSGCDEVQGFLVSHPLLSGDFESWLRRASGGNPARLRPIIAAEIPSNRSG